MRHTIKCKLLRLPFKSSQNRVVAKHTYVKLRYTITCQRERGKSEEKKEKAGCGLEDSNTEKKEGEAAPV